MVEKTRFSVLFRPTFLYAVLFTFCMYDNAKGILVAVLGIATVVYCRLIDARQGHKRKADSLLYEVLFVLLALSCGLTDNNWIVFCNLVGMLFVLVVMMIHDHQNDDDWSLQKYAAELIRTAESVLGNIAGLVTDIREENEQGKEGGRKAGSYILLGVLIAVPLLVVVIVLLCSADIVFASVFENAVRDADVTTFVLIAFMAVVAFVMMYACMRYFIHAEPARPMTEGERYEPLIAITALSVISIVYLLFSGIQIVYLFVGNMKLPKDYTYAQYARQGFFQLLVVCGLNLLIVLFATQKFREHKVLKLLLSVISGCTYIMIASSALRMVMYIREYHLTRKRILVLWALVVIAVLLVGVIIQIFSRNFRLFRYGIVVCVVLYLVLSFGRMDYWIARYNVEHCSTEEHTSFVYDIWTDEPKTVTLDYLTELSCDAAPVIAEYEGSWVTAYKGEIADVEEDSLRQWNLSRYVAKRLFR